jgi:large subunit ribosomal protein L10
VSDTVVAERRGRAAEPRAEKVAVVDEVRAKLSGSGAAILTEYRGLKVAELETLRRALRQVGGEYKIYKNTLVRFATADLGIQGIDEFLEGPTAIAFADSDVPAVAKALRDFSRTNPLLVVKGGIMGSSVLTAGDAAALAEIPSRDVLLARLAGLIAAPLQQFAGLLQALPRNLAYGLQALIDQRGGVPVEADASAPAEAAPAEADAPAEAAPAEVDAPAAADGPAPTESTESDALAPATAEATAESEPAEVPETPAVSPDPTTESAPAEPSAETTEGAE